MVSTVFGWSFSVLYQKQSDDHPAFFSALKTRRTFAEREERHFRIFSYPTTSPFFQEEPHRT